MYFAYNQLNESRFPYKKVIIMDKTNNISTLTTIGIDRQTGKLIDKLCKRYSLKKGEIVRLAFPIALQQFMTALVGACDAIMLGKLSQDAMSAVSLATQVTFVFNLFMFAFMAGENMFVAQYYGKGVRTSFHVWGQTSRLKVIQQSLME